MIKYEASCLVFTFIGPQMSEWINYNGFSALIPLLNGFLFAFYL